MIKIDIRTRTVFIFLTFIGMLSYANSFRVPFHYDDFHFLKENILIKSFPMFLDWLFKAPLQALSGRAFLLFTFYLNYLVNGLDTFGYHLVNFAIHIATACLFFLLLVRYVFREEGVERPWKSILAAAIFLLHPINTESVTYISSRSSELSTLLMLIMLHLFAHSTTGGFRPAGYALSILFFVLALSTKVSSAAAPVLLLLFDRCFLSRENLWTRRRLAYHLPFLAIFFALAYYFLGYIGHPEMLNRPWLTHILTEFKVFAAYCGRFFVPVGLSIDYDIQESVSLDVSSAGAAMFLAGLLAAAVVGWKKNSIISFSILWVFINLAPLMVLRLSDYMADRWAYAASLGFALGLIEVLDVLFGKNRKTALVLAAAIALVFGVMTISRNEVYRDPVTLWSDALTKSSTKIRPYLNLAAAYMDEGDIDKSIWIMERTIAMGNRDDETYLNLAMAYYLKGDLDRAEKLLLSMNVNASPFRYNYFYDLGVIFRQKKEYARAIEMLKKAAVERPQAPAVLGSIGQCYKLLGNPNKAREYFLSASQGIPQTSDDYLALAESYFALGENEKGGESLGNALRADPLNIHVREVVAESLLQSGNYDESYKHYSFMATISPRYVPAYIGMGRAKLGQGDKSAARAYFQKALSLLAPDSPERKKVEALISRT
jgi:tetratricopeptide (TPR) repeat protein